MRRPQTALERIVFAMLMVIGSALPFVIAWVLIASTNDENPLDRVPDYGQRVQETLSVAPERMTRARTAYEYRGAVRVIIEGTLTFGSGAAADAFYTLPASGDAAARTPHTWTLTVDGAPILAALGMDAPPAYDKDHVYTGVLDLGADWTRPAFDLAPADRAAGGDLRVTLIQLE